MKVYVLEQISYDLHQFRNVVGVFRSIEEINALPDDGLPVFESGSSELEDFEKVTDLNGYTHYEYTEYGL